MNAVRYLGLFASLAVWVLLFPLIPAQETENPIAADEAFLSSAGIKHDGASLLAFFKKRTPTDEIQAKIKKLIVDLGSDQYRVREKATSELLSAGRWVVPMLREAAGSAELEMKTRAHRIIERLESASEVSFVMAAARLLAARSPAGADEVLLNYFPFADDEAVEEELHTALAAVGVVKGKASEVLLRGLTDKNLFKRAASARAAGHASEAGHRELVRARLKDEPRVRLRAAQGLIAGKDNKATEALVGLIDDGPADFGREAENLLFHLAGEKSPSETIGDGTAAERKKARAAWDAWYAAEGKKIDLAKFDPAQRMIGLTLCVAWDSIRGSQGRMFEIDMMGQERWSVESVKHPVDGHMIRSDRFLVAEQSGSRVTERDLKGNILWEHKVTDSLVSCRRLPNGNTWIVCYRKIMEVTRDHKERDYPIRAQINGHLMHATRLRNGNIAYNTYGGELIEMDIKGEVKRTLKIDSGPLGLVKFEQLPNGNFLVPQQQQAKVQEIDAKGTVVWSCSAQKANSATRLPNGNILIASYGGRTVTEVNRAGKVVWQKNPNSGLLNAYRR